MLNVAKVADVPERSQELLRILVAQNQRQDLCWISAKRPAFLRQQHKYNSLSPGRNSASALQARPMSANQLATPVPKPELRKIVPTGLVANHNWEELEATALACKACPLYAGAELGVRRGSRQSMMFIGEGRQEEDRQGSLCGRARETNMIAAMGLIGCQDRKGHHRIIKCRPRATETKHREARLVSNSASTDQLVNQRRSSCSVPCRLMSS